MGSKNCAYLYNKALVNREKEMNKSVVKAQEISLIDAFWNILYHWRSIVIMALISMVAFGGIGRLRAGSTNVEAVHEVEATGMETSETEVDPYSGLSDNEIVMVDNALMYKRLFEDMKAYKEKSVYLNLDAYHENACVLTYLIELTREAESEETIKSGLSEDVLKKAYLGYVDSGAVVSEISGDEIGLEEYQLSELVSVVRKSTDKKEESEYAILYSSDIKGTEGAIFQIKVLGESEEEAGRNAELVDLSLKKYQSRLEKQVGNHDLVLVDKNLSSIVDAELAEKKISVNNSIIGYRSAWSNLIAGFSQTQRYTYDGLVKLENDKSLSINDVFGTTSNVTQVPINDDAGRYSILLKYGLLGLLIGIFCMSLFWTVLYVASGTVKLIEDISEAFGYYRIADFSTYRRWNPKKRLLFVDRWIDSLRNRNRGSYEDELRLMESNIKVTCQKNGINRLYFISSTRLEEKQQEMILRIIEQMKQYNVSVQFGCEADRDNEVYENMVETNNIIFVEVMKKSRWSTMMKLASMVEKQGLNVLGVVAL